MLASALERRKTFDSPLANHFSPVMQSSLISFPVSSQKIEEDVIKDKHERNKAQKPDFHQATYQLILPISGR
jgi:hypothetical protein